ncbi:FG-GAP repeat domain-containing protein [Brevundimonas sp.]|uniref:FG-GAP repeat domain-containing protein n=1 Tax=Brevundimonas sp. TaxID=1871086 RepID=UPI002FDAEAFB
MRIMTLASTAALLLALGLETGPARARDPSNGFRFIDVTDARLPQGPGVNTMDVVAVDLDGDGRLDLVTAQEWLLNTIMMGEADGRFRDASSLLEPLAADELAAGPPQLNQPGMGHDSEDIAVADFDGDGRLDLVIVQEDDVKFGRKDVHEYYRGTADGFRRMRGVLPDTEANAVAHADLNGDGRDDLLIVGAGQDRLLINDGRGGFVDETEARLPREAAVGQDGEFADLDGDGDLDIVLGLEGGRALWLNDGDGRFTDATKARLPPSGFVEARKVAPVDVDGDGDLDLYFSHVDWQGRDGRDALLINDGEGRFADETAARVPAETGLTIDARFADLDGDGDLDMVRADRPTVSVLMNDGTGRFTDVTAAVIGAVGDHVLAIELADFDGDGVTDLYLGQLRTFQGDAAIRDRLYLGRREN